MAAGQVRPPRKITVSPGNNNGRCPAGHLPFFCLGQYRIILSADTASEVRQLLSQKRR